MKKLFFWMAFGTLFVGLYLAAHNNLWKEHLVYDVWTFYARFSEFANTGNFSGFGSNEYLPMSLFFFLLPGIFSLNLDTESYVNIFILINLALIAAHIYVYRLIHKSANLYLVLTLFFTIGPILLFRFELLVSLLFLLSIYFFTKQKHTTAGTFVGLAIATKIYPIFVIPYFLFSLLKNKNYKNLGKYVLGVFLGALVPFVIYFMLKGSVSDPLKSVTYHAIKPIGVESFITSVVSLSSLIASKSLPSIVLENGIWGVPQYQNSKIINYLPYLVVGLVYLYLFWRHKGKSLTVMPSIIILLVFLFASKYLNPQYLFWTLGLLPLINFKPSLRTYSLLTNTVLILLLTQIIYPLNFSQLLDSFKSGESNFMYWLLQVRNLLLILEIVLLVKHSSLENIDKTLK